MSEKRSVQLFIQDVKELCGMPSKMIYLSLKKLLQKLKIISNPYNIILWLAQKK